MSKLMCHGCCRPFSATRHQTLPVVPPSMRLLGALAGLAILLVAVASRLLAELLLPADVFVSPLGFQTLLFVAAVGGGLLAAPAGVVCRRRSGERFAWAGSSASPAGRRPAWGARAIGRSDGGSIFLYALPLIPIAAFAGVVERALERESRRTEAGPWVTKLAGTGAIFRGGRGNNRVRCYCFFLVPSFLGRSVPGSASLWSLLAA